MKIILIREDTLVAEAAAMAFRDHLRLRERYPWMPEKREDEFVPRIEWMAREGRVYALADGGGLRAFIGWFTIEDYRNLGAAAFTPDWCSAVSAPEAEVPRLTGPLIRRLLGDLRDEGIPIHAAGIPSTNGALIEEFSLLGYGRIVLDAARPMASLIETAGSLGPLGSLKSPGLPQWDRAGGDLTLRPAEREDAKALSELDARLALHIASPPVLMPHAQGSPVGEWERWLENPGTLTYLAEREGKPVGFIKADAPHFDVSWFVHGAETMAICGFYVAPEERGAGIGRALLRALAEAASGRGYTLMSVDCETHNPEARGFWLRYFEPVTWSFERRF